MSSNRLPFPRTRVFPIAPDTSSKACLVNFSTAPLEVRLRLLRSFDGRYDGPPDSPTVFLIEGQVMSTSKFSLCKPYASTGPPEVGL